MMHALARQPEKVAILRALKLGDLLVSVPALRAIRCGFPEAEITLIGLPWAEGFVQRFSHYIDRFEAFPGWQGIIEAPRDLWRSDLFLQKARAYGYDLAIQMHGSGRTSNQFIAEMGALRTAGFYDPTSPVWLDDPAPYPNTIPEIWRCLRVAQLAGCEDLDPALEFPVEPDERSAAAALLDGLSAGRLRAGIHPGASIPARRWPAERFAQVADRLARDLDAEIILTGSPDEAGITAAVRAAMSAPARDLTGRTSLGTLAALIDELDLFVSNDTGPAHLAVARNTPSVRIIGPADVRRWAPLDRERHRVVHHEVDCDSCSYDDCPIDLHCMQRISTEQVLAEALALAGQRKASVVWAG